MSSSPAREALLKKQGAYGKVRTHGESKASQLLHLDEVAYALYYKVSGGLTSKLSVPDEDTKFCDDKLGAVSRSFAAVIRQLPEKCCLDVLIFYLVLRALDTIEDDMEAFGKSHATKIGHLNTFYKVALEDKTWTMDGVGEGDEKELLQHFDKCTRVYQRLTPMSKAVIADVTKRMGEGMGEFVSKDLGEGTQTVDEYNRYCYYVAGLVGEGLTRLFHACGYESLEFEKGALDSANVTAAHKQGGLDKSMGLFLQKTNIIRDYLEDYVDGRAFWPKARATPAARDGRGAVRARMRARGAARAGRACAAEPASPRRRRAARAQEVWAQYATETKSLGEFAYPKPGSQTELRSLACLNHLVTDALELVPDCISYMKMLSHPDIFRFCAIPQVMAIATLDKVYNNRDVFSGVVKARARARALPPDGGPAWLSRGPPSARRAACAPPLRAQIRKGLAVKMIMTCGDLQGIESWFHHFAVQILARVPESDPSAARTRKVCKHIISLTADSAAASFRRSVLMVVAAIIGVLASLYTCGLIKL